MHLNVSRDLRFVNFRSVHIEHPRRRDRSRLLRVRATFYPVRMEYRGRTSVGSVEFSDGRSSPGVILIAIAMREILNLRSGGCSLRPVPWPGLHFGIRKSCAYLVVIGCGWHPVSAAGYLSRSIDGCYELEGWSIATIYPTGSCRLRYWDIPPWHFLNFRRASVKPRSRRFIYFGRFSRACATSQVSSRIRGIEERRGSVEGWIATMDSSRGIYGGAAWDISAMTLFKFPFLVSSRLLHRSNFAYERVSGVSYLRTDCHLVALINPRDHDFRFSLSGGD